MTIAPDFFETPMLLGMPQEVQDALGACGSVSSRLGKPAEYAMLVKQIFDNPMLNGEVIRLDTGRSDATKEILRGRRPRGLAGGLGFGRFLVAASVGELELRRVCSRRVWG